MTFGVELLQAEPEVYRKVLALELLYGMVNCYVRARKKRVTIQHVIGHAEAARRCGASEEEILGKVRMGITDPPYSDSDRVDEIKRWFSL